MARLDDVNWFHEIPTSKVRGPDEYLYEPIWIHPSDAAGRGIENGDVVRIFNERGGVLVGAYVTERIMPGTVYVDHGARCDPIIPGELDRGGIYAGVFTPTEAGGAGAFATFVFGLAARRLPWNRFVNALVSTVKTSGMIFILIIGAMIFSSMLALSTLPFAIVEVIEQFAINRYVVLVAILIVFIILGFFLDIMSILLILLPVTFPVTKALGFDPVLVGVLTIITVLMGQISPPVGIVVYSVSGIVKDVPVMTIFRGAMPYFFVMALSLVIFIVFPEISLLLPNLMRPAG